MMRMVQFEIVNYNVCTTGLQVAPLNTIDAVYGKHIVFSFRSQWVLDLLDLSSHVLELVSLDSHLKLDYLYLWCSFKCCVSDKQE